MEASSGDEVDLYILLSGLLFVLSMSCGWSEVTMEDVKRLQWAAMPKRST